MTESLASTVEQIIEPVSPAGGGAEPTVQVKIHVEWPLADQRALMVHPQKIFYK
jgi:hypothetical protein